MSRAPLFWLPLSARGVIVFKLAPRHCFGPAIHRQVRIFGVRLIHSCIAMADADAPADLARILQLTLDIQILIISFLEPPYILRLRVVGTYFSRSR